MKLAGILELQEKVRVPTNNGFAVYQLYGVVEHQGNSRHVGHYLAHVRNSVQHWWTCDDLMVSLC